jgi:hypothetical protein
LNKFRVGKMFLSFETRETRRRFATVQFINEWLEQEDPEYLTDRGPGFTDTISLDHHLLLLLLAVSGAISRLRKQHL